MFYVWNRIQQQQQQQRPYQQQQQQQHHIMSYQQQQQLMMQQQQQLQLQNRLSPNSNCSNQSSSSSSTTTQSSEFEDQSPKFNFRALLRKTGQDLTNGSTLSRKRNQIGETRQVIKYIKERSFKTKNFQM